MEKEPKEPTEGEQFIESLIQQGVSPKDALIQLYRKNHIGTNLITQYAHSLPTQRVINMFGLSEDFLLKYYMLRSGFAKGSMEFVGDIPLADLALANVLITSGKKVV